MWLCEGELKMKITHLRLPSAPEKRACLDSQKFWRRSGQKRAAKPREIKVRLPILLAASPFACRFHRQTALFRVRSHYRQLRGLAYEATFANSQRWPVWNPGCCIGNKLLRSYCGTHLVESYCEESNIWD